jgi:hypothetical protein
MEPRQLCSSLLHKVAVRPGGGERAHVFQVAWRKSFRVRKRLAQVMRKAVDDFRAPPAPLLHLRDLLFQRHAFRARSARATPLRVAARI